MVNFWDLEWVWYILGFLVFPRITMIVVFSIHFTDGFRLANLFLPITIFWKYPALSLVLWMKLLFFILFFTFPRVLLGIVGIIYLPENQTAMVVFTVLGLILDSGMNRERAKRGIKSDS